MKKLIFTLSAMVLVTLDTAISVATTVDIDNGTPNTQPLFLLIRWLAAMLFLGYVLGILVGQHATTTGDVCDDSASYTSELEYE